MIKLGYTGFESQRKFDHKKLKVKGSSHSHDANISMPLMEILKTVFANIGRPVMKISSSKVDGFVTGNLNKRLNLVKENMVQPLCCKTINSFISKQHRTEVSFLFKQTPFSFRVMFM